MPIFRCKACQSVYVNPQRDGTSYFHTCAPIHNPAYEAQFTLDVDGNRIHKGPLNSAIPESLEHPNKRDENVVTQPDGKTVPKTPGTGRDTLP